MKVAQEVGIKGVQNDPALEAFMRCVRDVVKVFVEGLSNVEDKMSFRAMEFKNLETQAEKDGVADVLLTALALEIHEKAPKEGFAYSTSYDCRDDGSVVVWIHARRKQSGEPDEEEKEEPPIAAQPHSLEDSGSSAAAPAVAVGGEVNYVI